MKKTIFIIMISMAGLLTVSSCKKDYHCVCTLNGNTFSNNDLGNMSHHDAVNKCNSYDSGAGVTYQCNVQ